MKTNTWLAATLWLTLVCFGTSAIAQNAGDTPPVPPPIDATPAPKPSPSKTTKPATKAPKKQTSKVAKKDDAKRVQAGPISPGPAVVTEKNVNVRGKAAISGEVIAHLKRGDHVQVLEEVVLKNPKTDEPAKWAKIALPANAPVWVNSAFLDANKAVVPKKLNLRGGPGENYSVIGQLTKGTPVKEVEAKGNWLRIEAPADSYAFVAAHLISNDTGAPVLASKEVPNHPVTAAPPTTTAAPPTVAAVTPPVETPVTTAKPPTIGAEPAGTPPTVNVPPPITAAPPIVTPPADNSAKPPVQATTPVIAGPAAPEPDDDVKRFVTREGIVRRSVSIQAPTYFVLENLSNGKTINYLFSTNLVLKDFRGQRVLVTGEEMLDERWPNTPVIAIDKLEPVQAAP
jgi:SH3-like domain-containing protein